MDKSRIKKNYEKKLWNKEMIKQAVVKKVITAEEYLEIIGESYTEPILSEKELSIEERLINIEKMFSDFAGLDMSVNLPKDVIKEFLKLTKDERKVKIKNTITKL